MRAGDETGTLPALRTQFFWVRIPVGPYEKRGFDDKKRLLRNIRTK